MNAVALLPLFALGGVTGARGELSLGASVVYRDYAGSTHATFLGGSGSAGGTLYVGAPIVDDDAPLSLQPFLQRASTLSLTASVGGGTFRYDAGGEVKNLNGGAGIGANVFATRALAITAGFSAFGSGYPALPGSKTTTLLAGSLGLGVRGDLGTLAWRIDGRYAFTPFHDGTRWLTTWGSVTFGLRAAFARRVLIDLGGTVSASGGGAAVDLYVHFGKRFALFVGAAASHGEFVDTHRGYTAVSGNAGFSWWLTDTVGVSLSAGPGAQLIADQDRNLGVVGGATVFTRQ